MTDLERFTAAYFEALYFTDAGPDDEADTDMALDPEFKARMEKDCAAFWEAHSASILFPGARIREGDPVEHAGHDFWLTRNGHGAGFWDGDWKETIGDHLTKAAEKYGEVYVCVDDNGNINGD